ncbi:endonuclease/exonuclease/phosphatase family protein [Poseidonibacter lekithochrous]|uniref:endonuclease/exonuclease/phosphatase family protein n=1 Tax=Poseidonibacter lekithochrous TaxID=1904463 RepID=UPI000B28AB2C|nr:endonuclease/exonuclease/phosphatase family protein [Poseidonibacter lekithochrous]QKJ23703.1 endonuclease/exonuclease/phosphatase [Poseidonibacter lekithochrous]
MLRVFLFLCITINLFAQNFTVASYNVENLFDLKKQNTEYKEFIPFTKSKWNKKNFNIKLKNTIRVIKDINADIIAFQEIENKDLLVFLKKKLPQYKYHSFSKYPKSSVGIGFLSKIKIINNNTINVKFKRRTYRPIQETTFRIDNIDFKIFNNHWPSKRVAESYRIKYAKRLQDRLKKLPKDYDYILLGDFNSNYDEMQSFRYNKKLNNTDGITGINQVLNTSYNKRYVTYDDVLKIQKKVHFNLWLDVEGKERFSSKFRNQNNTPDNIIIPPALLDTKRISYIHRSFNVFKPKYLYKNKQVQRWKMKNRIHQGYGYSDHLPIYAEFSTNKENRNLVKKLELNKTEINKISHLYSKTKLIEPIILKNIIVIYKNRTSAIIKQKNDKAIYIYKNAKDLKLGYSYNIKVNQIKNYNDLQEIEDFEIIQKNAKYENYKDLYINNKTNILNPKYQNEIITNLRGIIKNRKLYFNGKVIYIYSKNKELLPKNNQNILIKTGHISVYRGNMQIQIHKKSDYKVEY